MADSRSYLVAGFEEGLDDLCFDYSPAEARSLGLRAARTALAPAVWRRANGDLLDTAQVADLLNISRQAIAKRVAAHSLVGLPGKRTTYFPAWQFDPRSHEVRPVVRHLIAVFVEEMGRIDPQVISAWASTPQADLDGLTVQQWLEKRDSQDDGQLIEAAIRAAVRLGE